MQRYDEEDVAMDPASPFYRSVQIFHPWLFTARYQGLSTTLDSLFLV